MSVYFNLLYLSFLSVIIHNHMTAHPPPMQWVLKLILVFFPIPLVLLGLLFD